MLLHVCWGLRLGSSSKVVICSVHGLILQPSCCQPCTSTHAHVRTRLTPCASRDAHVSPPGHMGTHALSMPRCTPKLRTSRLGLARLVYDPLLPSQHCPPRSAPAKSPHKVWRLRPIQHVGVILNVLGSLPWLGNTCPVHCCIFVHETRNPEQATQALSELLNRLARPAAAAAGGTDQLKVLL